MQERQPRFLKILFVRSISLGGFAALATYIVCAATHNVMASVSLLWILGGLSIAAAKLIHLATPRAAEEPA